MATNEASIIPVSVPLHPSAQWFRLDQGPKPASREDILIVLANIDSILIRATQSSDTGTAYLSDITLDTAVEQFTGKPKATSVEVCRCPPRYRGSSCESCAPGFYKDIYYGESTPLGSCLKCDCNNREESCELGPDHRVICHCLPGYRGSRCEEVELNTTIDHTLGVEMEMTPSKVVAPIGTQIPFTCKYRSRSSSDLYITIEPLSFHDYKETRYPGGAQITFYHVVGCTRQKIRCVVHNKQGRQVGVINVFVYPAGVTTPTPFPIIPTTTPQPTTIFIEIQQHNIGIYEVGSTVRYNCTARSQIAPSTVRVQWRKDGGELPPYAIDDGRGLLVITNLKVTDSGRYVCEAYDGYSIVTSSVDLNVGATNRAGNNSATFQIRVQETIGRIMRVDIQPPSYSGQSSETVILECSADEEINIQSIKWSRLGSQLPYNSREDRGTLIINNAAPEDSGIYVCTITSYEGARGRSNATVSITASTERKWPTASVSPERITLSQGQSTELHCLATGVPAPSIKWTKLGGELGSNAEQIGSVLHIRNSRVEDRGVYVCVSTNIHGLEQASSVVEVTRLESPRLEIYPQYQQTIVVGNSALLQCRAIAGIPSPSIIWSRADGRPLSPNIEEMSGGILRFTQVTPNEEGEYVCTANNEAGSATAISNIIVYTSPELHIIPDQDIITKFVNDSLRLECQGTGIPQPSVYWFKYDPNNLVSGS
ncbi:hypothetical protein NQ314_003001, partial [Rhamnusium bicolor]